MKSCLYFFIGLLLLSCKFSPSGNNFQEVPQIANPDLQINLEDYEAQQDIGVWGYVTFDFEIEPPERELYAVFALLNNDTLDQTHTTEFSFDSKQYADGQYQLSVFVYARSGTGSLADKLGVEAAVFTRVWRVHIDNAVPSPVRINKVEQSGQGLKITWQQYPGFNFQEYRLKRTSFFATQTIATITKRTQTSWIDTTYIGGQVAYSIELRSRGQDIQGGEVQFNGDLASFIGFENTESKIKLKWEPPRFAQDFKYYEIGLRTDNTYGRLAAIHDINVTDWVDETSRFGDEIGYALFAFSSDHRTEHRITAWIGHKIPEFYTLKYVPSLNSIYLFHQFGQLYRLDANTLDILNSINLTELGDFPRQSHLTFDISANGRFAYGSYWNKLFAIDPMSLAVTRTFETGDFLSQENSSAEFLYVTNDNRIIYSGSFVEYREPTLFVEPDSIIILDMSSKELVAKLSFDQGGEFIKVSNDGNYFISTRHLFRIENQWREQVAEIKFRYFDFIGDGATCVTTDNNTMIVRNSDDFSIISNLSNGISYLEPQAISTAGLIGAYSESERQYVIRSLNNGDILYRQNASPLYIDNYNYFFAHNKLFVKTGFYLDLPL